MSTETSPETTTTTPPPAETPAAEAPAEETPAASTSETETDAAAAAAAAAAQESRLSASLYVGDLDRDVNEATLFEVFKQVGPVASIRVCRDAVTRRSLGYAYVNFHTSPDDHTSFAERALDTLNYTSIKGKPCRIMWSHRDPSVRKSGVGNVFIKNMDKNIDNKALYDTFSAFGNILSCKVALDEHGNSKGYGFVHYEKQEEADLAILKVNEMLLNGKIVYVGPFIPKKERAGGNPERKFTNVYVKNLDPSVTEEKLNELFSRFGQITNSIVMKDDSKPKGFGFINFATPEQARAAVDEMNGHEINGKAIYVGRAQKKAEREAELKDKFEKIKLEQKLKWQGVNLFVKNLDDSLDDEKLKAEFTPHGTITSAKVMRDDKGNSKGFGFVCYSKPEEATKAVTEMNGRMLGSKPIYVALAQRKDERRAQLEAQYSQRNRPMGALMQHVPSPGGANPAMAGGNQMYPGTPMFYQGMPQQRQGFVYPHSVVPRPRWGNQQSQQGRPGFAQMPNYVGVPVQQRQQRNRGGQRQGPQQGGRGQVANGNNRSRYKFNANTRNQQQQQQQVRPEQGAQPEEFVQPVAEPLTATRLAVASPAERKQMLGESLFPLIAAQQPAQAGKITGMLLESIADGELLQMLEDSKSLNEKIQEALAVLQQHEQSVKEGQTATEN